MTADTASDMKGQEPTFIYGPFNIRRNITSIGEASADKVTWLL